MSNNLSLMDDMLEKIANNIGADTSCKHNHINHRTDLVCAIEKRTQELKDILNGNGKNESAIQWGRDILINDPDNIRSICSNNTDENLYALDCSGCNIIKYNSNFEKLGKINFWADNVYDSNYFWQDKAWYCIDKFFVINGIIFHRSYGMINLIDTKTLTLIKTIYTSGMLAKINDELIMFMSKRYYKFNFNTLIFEQTNMFGLDSTTMKNVYVTGSTNDYNDTLATIGINGDRIYYINSQKITSEIITGGQINECAVRGKIVFVNYDKYLKNGVITQLPSRRSSYELNRFATNPWENDTECNDSHVFTSISHLTFKKDGNLSVEDSFHNEFSMTFLLKGYRVYMEKINNELKRIRYLDDAHENH